MNIADAVNPFLFRHEQPSVKDPDTQIVEKAGLLTIYSALDQVIIAADPEFSEYAIVVNQENDLVVYGLDVVLATDLLRDTPIAHASRSISIYCRTLTVLGSHDDEPLTIDVSGAVNERCRTHIQPDVAVSLANASQKPMNGDDIAYALNNPSKENPYTQWFNKHPGRGWAGTGAAGGSITISCETLRLHRKLRLLANGAQGNAGIGGQNVKNWMKGLVGGDAGHGGRGGAGGTIVLTCSRVLDGDGEPANLFEWAELEANGGAAGDPGLPGFAENPSQKNRHFGSYARPVEPAESTPSVSLRARDISFLADGETQSVTDLSPLGSGMPLHFWALLYHRIKLEYLEHQPVHFRAPDASSQPWKTLGELAGFGARLAFAYGDTSDELRQRLVFDISKDREVEAKHPIARSLKLMRLWYLGGRTMWGDSVTAVPFMPFDMLCATVDEHFEQQRQVQAFYIQLRRDLADAIKQNDALVNMRNSARYAVSLHKANVEALRSLLFGSSSGSGVDAKSLLGALNSADSDCNAAIEELKIALQGEEIEKRIQDGLGITLTDVLQSIKSVLFVASHVSTAVAMATVEGIGLFMDARNKVVSDSGAKVAKAAVIKQVHRVGDSVSALENAVKGMVRNDQVGQLDSAILASLDAIETYIGNFTKVLGDVGEKILEDVGALRRKVNYKNQLWLEYNDRVYQLAKEWEEYQSAVARKQDIDGRSQQELTASLVDAVQLYTSIYLTNLERCAELVARLMRKYAYVTLDADLPSDSFLAEVTAFWDSDRASAQGIAEDADKNWDINKSALVGSNNSASIRLGLAKYNAGSGSIILHSPDQDQRNNKSTFFVAIDASRSDEERRLVEDLLRYRPVWIQVLPPSTWKGQYTDARGRVTKVPFWADPKHPDRARGGVLTSPLISGRDWDVRVTKVSPWMEGAQTDAVGGEQPRVQYEIRLGPMAYIMDSRSPAEARFFNYGRSLNTGFSHPAVAKLSDPKNTGSEGGEVSGQYIEMRGVFLPVRLLIPEGGINQGLRAAGELENVRLNVHFSVIYRVSVHRRQARGNSLGRATEAD